jgi:TolB-like protein/DNA-binding winged helix-turn-helix (wHTH) protein/Tfp pilus assembly protein PilF
MAVLECLAVAGGEVVTRNELFQAVWPGVIVTDDALTQCVVELRKAFGDSARDAQIIRTIPKVGFCLVPEVSVLAEKQAALREKPHQTAAGVADTMKPVTRATLIFAVTILLALAMFWYMSASRDIVPPVPVKSASSIAVLPFVDMSEGGGQEYFADGLSEELISALAHIEDLKVTGRTSSFYFKGKNEDLRAIGETLGVNNVLEGSVRKDEDQLRIAVQLLDASSGFHLWSEQYDRQLSAASIFAIQSEVASAITEELRATLSLDEQRQLATVPTNSLPALEAYFLGKKRMATRATDNLTKAAGLFQRAIELDPEFALAYVGLADTYTLQRVYAGYPQKEMNAKSELAINKALELDDRLGEAYASLGLLKTITDPKIAEAALKRAVELNPSYVSAHHWYGSLLSILGRPREALAHINTAVELDPLSAIINFRQAWIYMELGRYDEAMTQFKSIIADDSSFSRAYEGIGSLYRNVYGQLDKAVPWYEKQVSVDPGSSMGLTTLGLVALDLGDEEHAEYWIGRSRALAPYGYDTTLATHILHAYRGEDDQAMRYAQNVLNSKPRDWSGRVAAAYLRDRDLQAGRYEQARARYETAFPELLNENEPEIDGTNYGAAIDLALILSATGERERADLLLESSLAFIETIQRLGWGGYWISDVQIYALQGKTTEALGSLREAIDAGWRSLWWYYLKHNRNLDSIRSEPEFQAMVKQIEADMAAQLERVREMERDSEPAPVPGIVIESH